ncbi:hypothetical protein PHLGIDRAFT_121429 [Phlebiopsis gigantea 11061_1 CR5-6]|uniref:Protein kinase domain-containing protein n=1 Tax=Phlebiopsis gigantea (strain 11061_1 CR5-6) TaxID=745531 RepID=A0A0C3S5J7_PHLG1|nr:hypothetical protein PHLGIDRAFT_121429 [Phlebiopsis gigantea 11061_1 CR5-6]
MPEQTISCTPPAYLLPGFEVTVSLAHSAGSVPATILLRLPFTWNQVVLCELKSGTKAHPHSLYCGTRFALKISDPRYLPRPREDAPQWSYATEREAFPLHKENWKEFYFLICKTYQTSGSRGHGNLDLSIIDPERAVYPPAILIEYIDNAVTFKEVDVRLLDHALIRSFRVGAIDIMGSLGVGNNDLKPGNFLLAPACKPSRILLIDWANAEIRGHILTTDEQWEEYVETNGATEWLTGGKFSAAGLPSLFLRLRSEC